MAENWLHHQVWAYADWIDSGTVYPHIKEVENVRYNDKLVAYNFLIHPSGYILVPARDELPPVKMYSTSSVVTFNGKEPIPPFIEGVLLELYEMEQAVREVAAASGSTVLDYSENTRLWQKFDARTADFVNSVLGVRDGQRDMQTIGPLVTTRWAQGAPYNMFTPVLQGRNTLVGCVATAAAQIMRYHRWPARGQGSITYTWESTGQTITHNFASNTYNWANMPDSVTTSSPLHHQQAIARISADAGHAFSMDWGLQASGANTLSGATVLPRYFNYRTTARAVQRQSYSSDSAWMRVLRDEVQNSRPVLFSIAENRNGRRVNGHAVVVSGYRSSPSEQIHINMGWAGADDDWYASNNIRTGNFNFNWANQGAVIGIAPNRTTTTRTLTVRSAGAVNVPITATPAAFGGTTNYTRTNIPNNAQITLIAPASRGAAQFRNWTGCASVSGRTCRVVMAANRAVTANYGAATTRTLSVRSAGAINVPITATPATYRGTTNYTRTNIPNNAQITLIAPASRGAAQFRSWTGCTSVSGRTCRVVMAANRAVTANYGTGRLAAPTPTGPTGTTVPQPLFTWTAVQGAQAYELQIMSSTGRTIQHVRNIRGVSWRRPANLANGNYRFQVRAVAGSVFSPWSQTLNFTVGPHGRSYLRLITLTWGAQPRDLDAHLRTPTGHHVFYSRRGSQTSPPYAQLDIDHRQGRGPENISIYRFVSSGNTLYRYYVHNWSNERPLAGSGARVAIQDRTRTLRTFVAPGSGSGRYWHVFNMNSSGTIIPINRIVSVLPASGAEFNERDEDIYPPKD